MTLTLDAEALYAQLRDGVAARLAADAADAPTHLVGIGTGGAWLAERLHADLKRAGEPGVLSIALHRDDFDSRGLAGAGAPTKLPFEIDGAQVLLVDDVLYTGRTVRAAMNELYDFGRPARIALAVLVDRGGRELPVAAELVAARFVMPAAQRLALARGDDGRFSFAVEVAGGPATTARSAQAED